MRRDPRAAAPISATLTFDVTAPPTTASFPSIDCLQLNRLARTAGAPIDKGAGIKLFKKIGDRVEKGEPLYRIHAFDQSELDLAVAAATRRQRLCRSGRDIRDRRDHAVSAAIQCLPSSSRDAARLAAAAGRTACTRSPSIGFPTAKCG